MERPERIVLRYPGRALRNRWGVMAPALWVLAIFSTLTVIHRIRYTYLETERRKAADVLPGLMQASIFSRGGRRGDKS